MPQMKTHLLTLVLIVLTFFTSGCNQAARTNPEPAPQRARQAVPPITVDMTEDQIKQSVANVRAGRKLTPKAWPNRAQVAICLSFDVDNESLWIDNPLPITLSEGEYGATSGLPRVLALLDRKNVPASFYIPAMSIMLHPQMIKDIMKSGRNEIGVHGWVHEDYAYVNDAAKEQQLL